MRICTVVARNHLPHARALARSYAQHNGGAPCTVLLIDDPEQTLSGEYEPFELIRPDELGIPRFAAMAAMYERSELATALKPWLLRGLLEREHEPIAYLDPDTRCFDDLSEIGRLAAEHDVVLTPHLARKPIPQDGRRPSELDLLASGTYNLGFIALTPGADAEQLLDCWSARLHFDCVIAQVEHCHSLRDPGFNVAYWNLHERPLQIRDGRYLAAEHPLRFFHFSGFDPERPHLLSKHQDRFSLAEDPVLAGLCADYALELREEGFDSGPPERWAYERLPGGTPLSRPLRRLYNQGERLGRFEHSPFSAAGEREFRRFAREAAPSDPEDGFVRDPRVSRLSLTVYEERPDLRRAFPDLAGGRGAGLVRWLHEHGVREYGLDAGWLPPAPPESAGAPADGVAGARARPRVPWGVNVAGYLQSELGLGEAARAVIAALDAASVPLLPVQGRWLPNSRQGHTFPHVDTSAAAFPVNLVCVNADELPEFLLGAGPQFSQGRYTIGFWWWEVTSFPERSRPALEVVDELWVATEHVARALRPLSEVPVITTPIPVTVPPVVPHTREQLGLPEGLLFLTMFDFQSVFERKNPLGAIDAFREAFEPGSGAKLVVKCINHHFDPVGHDRLRRAARTHPDIHLIERYVSPEEKDAMLAGCDCFVSLHRAEGFGLPLAEAMYLGRPVIATAYSGNLDFMTAENSYLVEHGMVPVGEGRHPYPADGEWAEPDTSHAAKLMREVAEDRVEAELRGARAASDIRRTRSPQATGRLMAARLATVREHMQAGGPLRHPHRESPLPGLAEIERLIGDGPPRPPAQAPTPRALARKLALRAMRPLIAHQRQIDERIVALVESQARALAHALERERGSAGVGTAAQLAALRLRERQLRELRREMVALKQDAPAETRS